MTNPSGIGGDPDSQSGLDGRAGRGVCPPAVPGRRRGDRGGRRLHGRHRDPHAGVRDRIRYERVRHGGAGWARNSGIDLSRNPLVAFLDSDDEWLPGKLELQRALMAARPDVLFCFTDWFYRRPNGKEFHGVLRYLCGEEWFQEDCAPAVPFSSIAALPAGQADVPVYVGDLYAKQMEKEFVQVGTLVYRRDGPAAALRFPEDLRIRQDWEFVGRLARLGPAAYLDYESEVVHRHAEGQLTNLDDFLLVKVRMKAAPAGLGRGRGLPAHPRRALPPAARRAAGAAGQGPHRGREPRRGPGGAGSCSASSDDASCSRCPSRPAALGSGPRAPQGPPVAEIRRRSPASRPSHLRPRRGPDRASFGAGGHRRYPRRARPLHDGRPVARSGAAPVSHRTRGRTATGEL